MEIGSIRGETRRRRLRSHKAARMRSNTSRPRSARGQGIPEASAPRARPATQGLGQKGLVPVVSHCEGKKGEGRTRRDERGGEKRGERVLATFPCPRR